ncbi:MAG: pantoate--beta-alanine ligase [Chitinophagales bacterium]
MLIYKKTDVLKDILRKWRENGEPLNWVPTMGALHDGHISLIEAAKQQKGHVLCSIFINPTQFNDPNDFKKYPVTIEKDIYLLESNAVDLLFLPSVDEIYPAGFDGLPHYDLGYLESILEGKFRPGHFQGVCQVMDKMLQIIEPDYLYMGQKDYQQCMIIRRLLEITGSKTVLYTCPTKREPDGLAMSSRNIRLTAGERKKANAIFQALHFLKENLKKGNLMELISEAKSILAKNDFRVDYAETVDADSLQMLNSWDGKRPLVALIAAFQKEVRLIDNMILTEKDNSE